MRSNSAAGSCCTTCLRAPIRLATPCPLAAEMGKIRPEGMPSSYNLARTAGYFSRASVTSSLLHATTCTVHVGGALQQAGIVERARLKAQHVASHVSGVCSAE